MGIWGQREDSLLSPVLFFPIFRCHNMVIGRIKKEISVQFQPCQLCCRYVEGTINQSLIESVNGSGTASALDGLFSSCLPVPVS